MRLSGWANLSSSELWAAWRAQFPTLIQAEVEAIWMTNRLVKTAERSTRSSLYEVKDLFIAYAQPYLIEGRKVREEIRDCRVCFGFRPGRDETGDDDDEDYCEHCGGTGIWSRRVLYLHLFDIEGRHFSFHSYVGPKTLSETWGEDLEQYGGQFTEQERAVFFLPMAGLLRLLRYHAHAHGFGKEALGDETGA